MNTDQGHEIENLKYEAVKAMLEAIASNPIERGGARSANLAEAVAWLLYPAQPHGGSAVVKT